MAVIESAEDFRIGRVVSRLFEVLRANAVLFLALAALSTIPTMLLSIYTLSDLTQGMTPAGAMVPGRMGRFFEITTLSSLLYLIFTFLLQAALTQSTICWLNNEKPNFGNSLSVAVKNFLPLVGIALLAGLGVMLGMVLIFIPGIILAMMWSVVVPVKIVEGTSINESFGRSRALTKGYRGRIFLLFLAYFVVAIVINIVISLLMAGTMLPKPGDINPAYLAFGWIVRVVLASITAVGVTSIYYELRLVKEGIGAQQMAAAFD
ncbi:MAG TPA: hypothetical protein VGG66_07490 [Rhizomicrobium sp.]